MYSSSKYSDLMNDNQSTNHYYSGYAPPPPPASSTIQSAATIKTIYTQEPLYTTYNPNQSNVPLVILDPPTQPHVKSFIVWSIFNLFCCGFIAGLVTTLLSLRVISLKDKRLFKEASKLSDKLLLLNIIVTIIGGIVYLVAFPYFYVAIYPFLPKINY